VGRGRLLLRYVLPNIAETLIVTTTVGVSSAIVAIAGLSFLGLGVQPPSFDWGRLLTEGVNSFYQTPAAALGPATAIGFSALVFGLTGEGLARALNPLLWTRSRPGAAEMDWRRRAARYTAELAAHREEPVPSDGAHEPVVLEVRDLTVTMPGAERDLEVVSRVSFKLRKGEVLGIVGESGSGKTMTAMGIAQLVAYPGRVSGEVTIHGHRLREMQPSELARFLGTELAVVYQDPAASLNPALTVGVQLTEHAEEHRHLSRNEARELAISRLGEVHMPTPERQLHQHPHEFSGGQRQRLMIAMGLMNNPTLLIADEPTTALDVTIQAQIMDLLHEINRVHETAIILISHNLALIKQNCDRVLVMYAGRVVEELPAQRLRVDPLHPYTKALLAAVPDLARNRAERLASVDGQPPDFGNLPAGCAFHPRCPFAIEKCASEIPPLLGIAGGRRVACWVAQAELVKQASG
jgi:oligopeptide/dipeptide ABC transporter ATP-binding protein